MNKILFLVFSFISIYAQDAFISAKHLMNSFDNEKLVLIDVSDKYKVGHIQGAISFNVDYLIDKEKSYNGLKSHRRLQEIFSNIGLENNSNIVIYGRSNFTDLKYCAFLAFTLISSGFENVSILDGGYMSWVFEDDSLINKNIRTLKTGKVTLDQKKLTIDADEIRDKEKHINIIDARDRNLYDASHISGASNCSFRMKFKDDFTLMSSEKIKYKCIGYLKDNSYEKLVYSDDIFTSSLEWFIINRAMGFKSAKIYYNSFGEYKDLELDIIRKK